MGITVPAQAATDPIRATTPADYTTTLANASVVVSAAEREHRIRRDGDRWRPLDRI